MPAEVTHLQEGVSARGRGGEALSICLTTNIMGRKTEIWGGGGGGSRGGGGFRVNIVMISPEFRSGGRETEREKGGERAAAVLSPPR